ncbi:MAG: zinc ABC transporter substrate-binding protein [Bdellovibrionota bacterium]
MRRTSLNLPNLSENRAARGIGAACGILAASVVFLFLATAAHPAPALAELSKPLVAVSIPPLKFFVERLAGSLVETLSVIPAGANHETFEPSMKQLRGLSRASVYVRLGHPQFAFETIWLDRMLADSKSLRIVNASSGLTLNPDDMHYWTSPKNSILIVKTIAQALRDLLPNNADTITHNELQLAGEIEAAAGELRLALQNDRGCTILVYHPAWGYFADELGLKQLAIEQDGKEPGMLQLRKLIEKIRGAQLHTLVTEPASPRQAVELLSSELGITPKMCDPLAEDWLSNLRELGSYLQANLKGCSPSASASH